MKKRKGNTGQQVETTQQHDDTSKPSAVFKPTKGRAHTVSIAIPGSIIDKYAHTLLFSEHLRIAALTLIVSYLSNSRQLLLEELHEHVQSSVSMKW